MGSNYRPSLIDPHNREAHNRIDTRINNNIYDWNYESQIPQQNMHASPIHEEQPISAEPTVGDLSPFELLNLGPGPPSFASSVRSSPQHTYLSCSEAWNSTTKIDTIIVSTRKRFRKEVGRFGRNIKQRLCCALFDEEVLQVRTLIAPAISLENCNPVFHAETSLGLREAGAKMGI